MGGHIFVEGCRGLWVCRGELICYLKEVREMIVGVWRDFVIEDRKFSGSRIFVGVTVVSIKSTMIIARGVFVGLA